MAWYPYSYKTAFNPISGEKAPAGSVGEVYAVGDTGFTTPLETFDLSGLPVSLEVQGDVGYVPSFQVEDNASVIWKSGDYIFEMVTSMPLPGPQGSNVVGAVDNGDGTVTFSLSNGESVGPVGLPEGPEGPRGPQGYNATGAVEDQQALADYVNEAAGANPFSGALNATYASHVDVEPLARTVPAWPTVGQSLDRRLALANRTLAPFDILGLGDSLFSGQAVTSKYHRWPNRMLDRVREELPAPGAAGGFGYVPAIYVHNDPANQAWAFTGFTAGSATYGLGRQSKTLGPDQGSGAGAGTITMDCTSFTLAVYRVGNDAFTISIDGAVVHTATAGPLGLWEWDSGQLGAGEHEVIITETAGAPVFNGAMFYNGDESRGIRYWDGAQSGSRADQFNAADGGKSEWADNIGTLVAPDLVLVEWMTNDFTARTPAQYETSLTNILQLVRTKTTAPILWVAPYERITSGFGGALWSEYVTAMQNVAGTDTSSDFVNVNDYVPRLSPDSFGALADGTHPSDKFAAYLGVLLADYITGVWPNA